MTVLLLAGVNWVGSYDLDPPKPIASTEKPVRVQVVSLDWKWLFIYPDQGIASVNQLTIPVGTPVSFELTSSGVMNSFLGAAAGRPDLHDGGNGDAPTICRRTHPGTYRGRSANYSGSGFADMYFDVDAVPAERFAQWVDAARSAGPALDAQAYADLTKPEQSGCALHVSFRRSQSVQSHLERRHAAGRCVPAHHASVSEDHQMNLLGKLSWSAIPFHEPIIMGASAMMILGIVLVLGWITS